MRAARAMAMVMKRAMATDGNNTGNGYYEEGSGQAMAVKIAMGLGWHNVYDPLRYDWREEDEGGNGLWFVCVCLCVWSVERHQK